MSTYWDLTVLVVPPLVALVVVGLLVWSGYLWRNRDEDEFTGFAIALWAVSFVVVVATLLAFYPYEARFHQWRPVSGTVQQVTSRLIGEDKSTNQVFLVQIAGHDYRVDDTRGAGLKAGDQVSLMCRDTWEYAAAAGTVCRWGGSVVNR
ncbi:MAG: hypothetical protein BGO38_06910 [Cellulomonas sp. 73-145]|uniref:hypothetical protein n=1 Tax=Cellulomonas sp. 73-145 TaxID=1895739 RepID=UPI00092B2971|nr:hypothetical protein [Cellulomonas sp. 73-145]OJV57946.1 MAG: hypothetical protein BGO38_06910 [Cellulomonas sp. 73-145]